MKKIVLGNDFTMKIAVRKSVGGRLEKFPLPAATDVEVNLVNAFTRKKLTFNIGVEDDSMIEARVVSAEMALGSYALEVKGKLFGCAWRSNEYEQIMFVNNNASGDTEFGGMTEGENSVEMDTAIAILPPTVELGDLIERADKAAGDADAAATRANDAAEDAKRRTDDAISDMERRTADAVQRADTATNNAIAAKDGAVNAMNEANKATGRANAATDELDAKFAEEVKKTDAAAAAANTAAMTANTAATDAKTKTDEAVRNAELKTGNAVADAERKVSEAVNVAGVATGKANDAAKRATDAALGAERVDAVLGDDNVLTITDRNGNKKSLTLQSVAEALEVAKLVMQHDAELAALPLDNLGDATAENMDFLNYPTMCGCPTIVICEEAPNRAPDFVGQRWIDKKAKKEYVAFGVSNAGDFYPTN